MVQQTAVSYIISQLRQLAFNENTHLGIGDVRVTQGLIDELEERAKQMEKEQIIEAAKINLWCAVGDGSDQAEQYYNETYSK